MPRYGKRGTRSRRRSPRKGAAARFGMGRGRALEALGLMRSKHRSLARAAREVGSTPRTIKRHIGSALFKTEAGRYRAQPSDHFVRSLRFLVPDGQIVLAVRGSRQASVIGGYFAAVERYLKTGLDDELNKFAGKSLRIGRTAYPFVTDLDLIERLGNAGEVRFEDLYAAGG